MTQALVKAFCGACGKTYRVPDGDGTYRCKACGGSVRATAGPPAARPRPELPPTRPRPVRSRAFVCSACGGIWPTAKESCPECGAKHAKRGAAEVTPELLERSRLTDAIESGHNAVKGVQALYLLGAAFGAIGGFVSIPVLAADPQRSNGSLIFLCSFNAVYVLLSLVGAIQMPFRPVPWTVLNAVWCTFSMGLKALVVLVAFSVGQAIALLVKILWAVLLWIAAVWAFRYSRLVRAHPELCIVQRIQGSMHRSHGAVMLESPEQVREAWRQKRIKANRQSWLAAGLACLVYAGEFWLIVRMR